MSNDDPPSRNQRPSQPSQECDAEKVQIEIPTAEDHNNLFAEIEKLKQQTRDLRLKVANCDDTSGQLTGELTGRSESISTIERRVGLMYLVSRLHGGDQQAPYNIRDAFIGSKISNAGQGPGANAFIDSVFLDTTNLARGNDNSESQKTHNISVTNDSTGITSLDNFKHSPLDGKLIREGSSISGQQEGLSTELVKDISTTTLDISQELQLDEEEGTKTLNISQDQPLVEGEGKNSRRSRKHLSEETADTRRDKSAHKVIEGQKLQKAEYSQKPKSRQNEIDEIARLHDEILLLQNVVGEASENGLNGSSEERTFARAKAFSRNLANSLTEQDKANGSEMLDELVKENAYLTEKLRILASVDLDSRVKTGALQDAVGSQPHQSSSAASGTSAPNPADMPSGLLATKEAALILASIKIPRQNQPRQPVSVDSIEPTNYDAHDKSTSQDLSTSQRTWRMSQSGKPNSDSGLQGEISETKPQIEFKLAVTEDSRDNIFLNQSKDRRQPVIERSDPTPPNVAENEGQVNNDGERKRDSQPRKADFSTQLGAYTTTEMPLRLIDSTKNAELITNEESANSPQEKPSYPQSSSTAERAREASDDVHEAHSECKTKVGGKTAPFYVSQEVEYVYHGCDHPFL